MINSNSYCCFHRYSLRGDTKKYFSIGKYSGELKTVQALDREENSTYTMEVVAEDGRKRYFTPSSCCAFTVEGCQFMLFVWINMSIKLKLLYRASTRRRCYQCETSGENQHPSAFSLSISSVLPRHLTFQNAETGSIQYQISLKILGHIHTPWEKSQTL